MTFAHSAQNVESQFAAVRAAPIPFLLVISAVSVCIWIIVRWYFSGQVCTLKEQINAQDGRLKLRDDEIEHLKRLTERSHETFVSLSTALEKTKIPKGFDDASAIPQEDIYFLPWRVFIPPEEREYVNFANLNEMLDANADATSARKQALVSPYIRKWVRVQVNVQDVDAREEETCVSSVFRISPYRMLWMHFTRDRESLLHLAQGDKIALVGWIAEARSSEFRLYGCERVPL